MPGKRSIDAKAAGGSGVEGSDPALLHKAREMVRKGIHLMEHDGYKEAADVLDEARGLVEGGGAGPDDMIRTYAAISRLNLLIRDLDKCEAFALKAMEEAKRKGTGPVAKGEAMNAYGAALAWKGDLEPGLRHLERALSFFEAARDEDGIAKACRNIGTVYLFKSLYAKGLAYYNRAAKIYEKNGKEEEMWSLLLNTAVAKGLQGLYTDAISDFTRLIDHCGKQGKSRLVATSHTNIAFFYERMGDYDKAFRHYDESMTIYSTLKMKTANAHNIFGKAEVLVRKGDVEAADRLMNENYKDLMATKSDDIVGRTLKTMGIIHRERGALKKSEDDFALAERVLGGGVHVVIRALVYVEWARTAHRAGDDERAGAMMGKARDIYKSLNLSLLQKELDRVAKELGI